MYDVCIIGAGPAGLSAAIYAKRANLKTLVIENGLPGGKLHKTFEIENYPGVSKIAGSELANQFIKQINELEIEIIKEEIIDIEFSDIQKIILDDKEILTKTIIFATGTNERQLELPRSDQFVGKGISYCAVCDGFFYRGKEVVVIGGGNSALEEALYLSLLAKKINIVIRNQIRADETLIEKIKSKDNIEIFQYYIPQELVIENDTIVGLKVENVKDKTVKKLDCQGIFPYIGSIANNQLIPKEILNQDGYLIVNQDMSTNIRGVWGAGDIIQKELKQVVTACSDGAIAANSISKYLKNL